MSDDIVTRLREINVRYVLKEEWFLANALTEAADEIERLREEVATWKNIAERAVEWCFRRWQPGGEFENQWMPFSLRELKHDYEKALGHE